jgi:type I site-specific restriction-modification system R (restriction) subunit
MDEDSDEADLLVRRLNMLNQEMMALVDMTLKAELSLEEYEQKFKEISEESAQLTECLEAVREASSTDEQRMEQAAELERAIESLKNCGCEYNDNAVRQMIECIKVYPNGKLDIIFNGGFTIVEYIEL